MDSFDIILIIIIFIFIIFAIIYIFISLQQETESSSQSVPISYPIPTSKLSYPTSESLTTINGTIVLSTKKDMISSITYGKLSPSQLNDLNLTQLNQGTLYPFQKISINGFQDGLEIYSPNKNYSIHFNKNNGIISINKNNITISQFNNVQIVDDGIHSIIRKIINNTSGNINDINKMNNMDDYISNGNWTLQMFDYGFGTIELYIICNGNAKISLKNKTTNYFNICKLNVEKYVSPFNAVIQDDGNFGIYDANGKMVWSINTGVISITNGIQYKTNFTIPQLQPSSLLTAEQEQTLIKSEQEHKILSEHSISSNGLTGPKMISSESSNKFCSLNKNACFGFQDNGCPKVDVINGTSYKFRGCTDNSKNIAPFILSYNPAHLLHVHSNNNPYTNTNDFGDIFTNDIWHTNYKTSYATNGIRTTINDDGSIDIYNMYFFDKLKTINSETFNTTPEQKLLINSSISSDGLTGSFQLRSDSVNNILCSPNKTACVHFQSDGKPFIRYGINQIKYIDMSANNFYGNEIPPYYMQFNNYTGNLHTAKKSVGNYDKYSNNPWRATINDDGSFYVVNGEGNKLWSI